MKKVLALILALVMVAAVFAGCAKEEAPADNGTEGGKTYKIIYLTPSTASDFWSQVETGIKQATKDYEAKLGIKIDYSVMGPAEESDAEGYVKAFENAIAAKPDAILTATLNIDPTVPKAKEAHDQGIVLNFVNCGLGNGDDGAYAEYYNEFYYCSNTTIGVVATDVKLTKTECSRLATVAHDGYALAIRPVHTIADGDTLFAVSHGEYECEPVILQAMAVQVVAQAIVNAVRGGAEHA